MIEPQAKPAPAHGDCQDATIVGVLREEAIPIFVYESVLEEILDYSEQELTKERGGFLVGGLYRDEGDYLEIRHFLPAQDAQSRSASLTFTHDTWSQLNREVEERYADEIVVGWHHTHPNFGVFLSPYDLFIHKNFFGEPWQVALVVDPHRHEFRFYQWVKREIFDCGFVCVRSNMT